MGAAAASVNAPTLVEISRQSDAVNAGDQTTGLAFDAPFQLKRE